MNPNRNSSNNKIMILSKCSDYNIFFIIDEKRKRTTLLRNYYWHHLSSNSTAWIKKFVPNTQHSNCKWIISLENKQSCLSIVFKIHICTCTRALDSERDILLLILWLHVTIILTKHHLVVIQLIANLTTN